MTVAMPAHDGTSLDLRHSECAVALTAPRGLQFAHTFASRIPGASLVTFESDDHWVARECVGETAAAVRALISTKRVLEPAIFTS
jgi:hypothetical protein